ncbi:MAG TPA: META domain-containing protein [Candidatus Binatia bacterium]
MPGSSAQSSFRRLRVAICAGAIAIASGCATTAPWPVVAAPPPAPSAPPVAPAADVGNVDLESLFGHDWIFVEIPGFHEPLPSALPVAGFIMTRESGRILTGTTGCNQMSSGYRLYAATGRLEFTNLRNNRRLCDRVSSDTEEAVLHAMIATDSFRMVGGDLELWSKGSLVARLVHPVHPFR